jgi:hypothetical protein
LPTVVRWIFDQCLTGKTDSQIARDLDEKAVPTATGRPWNRSLVSRILQNETYIANIVYNRQSRKLGAPKVNNPISGFVGSDVLSQSLSQRYSRRQKGGLTTEELNFPKMKCCPGCAERCTKKDG